MKKLTNNNHTSQKGITLIALVITIIVLLILAGVAINMAINSDGLFGKANEAVKGWNTAVENERVEVQELLNELGITSGNEEPPVTLPAGWDSNKIASTVTETSTITGTNKERVVPIPKGFVASQIGGTTPENTISGGLVIYQIPEGATVDWGASTITIGGTTTNLQETVNQFVWIPVDDVNQMVMCKSNTSTSICNLKLQADGTLKCETHNSTALCGRLYGANSTSSTVDGNTIRTTSMDFADRTQTWTDNSGYREPDVLGSSYDNDANTGNLATFTSQMTNDFANMATSAAKYGGFYVSRYEAGVNGASKKNQIVITAGTALETPRVYQGVNKWYGLYNAVKSSTALGETVVSTHMIYGSQYDQIINFIGSEAQTGHPGNVVTAQSKTGTKETDRLNNLYDLEGNNWEWTSQADITNFRVYRGGTYLNAGNGNFLAASYRSNGYGVPAGTGSDLTTRLSLYL